MVYLPKIAAEKLPAMVIELKYDKSPVIGIEQIINNKYYYKLKKFKNNLLLVGISYTKKNKKHCCKIVKFSDLNKK